MYTIYYYVNGGIDNMHVTGGNPGKGRYLCTNCSKPLYLEDSIDTLPLCPECGNHQFING